MKHNIYATAHRGRAASILIEEVEQKQGVYNTLLPSLRILLNSVYCQEAVHLVLCGSNKLIRYMDGGTLNQLFQQFGDNVVEIGKLLERDMKKMLEAPYQNYPNVKISDEAIKWIWKYTNGLVWYSKLIANCALNRARGQERYECCRKQIGTPRYGTDL